MLAQESGQRAVVESLFAQQVFKTQRVDDRIESLSSEEELPLVGTVVRDGTWVEATKEQVEKRIDTEREAWKKAHPKADKDSGPFSYRTSVTLRRNGVTVPQTLVVKFADGSRETVKWDSSGSDGDPRWQR